MLFNLSTPFHFAFRLYSYTLRLHFAYLCFSSSGGVEADEDVPLHCLIRTFML